MRPGHVGHRVFVGTSPERHFAWVKRYFGLNAFQCCTYIRVYQFVLLTYCCVVAVALAAYRYQRPDLIHQRIAVLAVKTL